MLRTEDDPLPPFVTEMREIDGEPLRVMRVFPSADAPHTVRGTGAVYVRCSKGKEPVHDHPPLLELAQRGRNAQADARERPDALPGAGWVLRSPDFRPEATLLRSGRPARCVMRAAPRRSRSRRRCRTGR